MQKMEAWTQDLVGKERHYASTQMTVKEDKFQTELSMSRHAKGGASVSA